VVLFHLFSSHNMLLTVCYIEDTLAPSGSEKVPVNKYHEHGTSQQGVLDDYGSDWREKLEIFTPDSSRILRLVKNPLFAWKSNTTAILGVLQRIPHVAPAIYEQMRDALRGFHDSGAETSSKTRMETHDKRSGTSKPSLHIGFWAKGSRKRDGKPPGYPWVTDDTVSVEGNANGLYYLKIVCSLLRDHFNTAIMNILRVEDPELWLRMQLYVSFSLVRDKQILMTFVQDPALS
jgi:hypothetical protein